MSRFLLCPLLALVVAFTASAQGTKSPSKPDQVAATAQGEDADPFEGIVRIEASFLNPDYRTPWQSGRPASGSGTGWLIGKNKFLTNAHVVSNATELTIRTTNDPKPYKARVVHIAHDCDLAMLEAEDAKHFENMAPLQIDAVPKLNTEVITVGYPIGGERVSVTRGVVSRIDFQSYSHSGIDQHLAIQVDAAINPGNSGGPVLQNGKVVGVAFQGYSGAVAQNVGYMIPLPVIQRFLKDIADGEYDHYMDLAIADFPIENPAQIKALGLEDNGIGVMVANVDSASCASGVIEVGDVILAMDGNPVYNNGLIRVDGEMMDMNEIVERKFAGDSITVDFMRKGVKQKAQITLKRFLPYLLLGEEYGKRPRYVLYAGLLFQPMNRNLMDAHGIRDPFVSYWFSNFLPKELYKERSEPVILTTILPDEVNSYLAGYQHSIVDEINGVKITSLRDVANALKKKEGDGKFVVIKLMDKNRPLALRRDLADEAHPHIMRNYDVRQDSYLGND
ncbi:MAG: trypsin-like peptidase domain-containing protein [Roseimicrobium sp.]